MKPIILLSAGCVLAANMALASVTPDALAAAYQAKGYSSVEVTQGPHQIKVEAIRNHAKVEVVYDATSGAILKQEQSRTRGAKPDAGVKIAATDQDFLDDKGLDPEDVSPEPGDDTGTDTKAEHESEHEGTGSDGSGHDGGNDGGHDGGHDGAGD